MLIGEAQELPGSYSGAAWWCVGVRRRRCQDIHASTKPNRNGWLLVARNGLVEAFCCSACLSDCHKQARCTKVGCVNLYFRLISYSARRPMAPLFCTVLLLLLLQLPWCQTCRSTAAPRVTRRAVCLPCRLPQALSLLPGGGRRRLERAIRGLHAAR